MGMSGSPARERLEESRFVGLVKEHQAGLWRYLRFLGCDGSQAEDLVQETFLRVWRRPYEDRGPAAVAAYLRTVARNLFIDASRRKLVRPAFLELESADAVWERHVGDDDGRGFRAALRACLRRLPERSRRALGLFYGEGRSRDEVGSTLGMTVDGVKTMLRRARESLRACIERKVGA
jgi:RNA polymerase sigma-70 factor (ECF subfamily)